MGKKFLFIVLSVIIAFSVTSAQTIIPGGYVSGIWTSAGSPYLIQGEITVHDSSTLIINSGVEVIFQGRYKFIINGKLDAIGTENDSIRFTAAIPDTGWRGLRFMEAAHNCNLQYCIIEYGKATFYGTFHDRHGGGIYSYFSYLNISNCSLRNNFADLYGGGIYFLPPLSNYTFLIKDCNIINNTANEKGGGIYSGASSYYTLDIQNCLIRSNTSQYQGGGLYLAAGATSKTQHTTDCTLEYNQADDQSGGIIYNNAGKFFGLFISGSDISNNEAVYRGGGICVDAADVFTDISNCTFMGNQAPGALGRGGAIYAETTPIIQRNTIFAENLAFEGGAAYLAGSAVCKNNTYASNTASSGSAFFVGSGGQVRLENSILYSNAAAAVHLGGNALELEYSDFHSNGIDITGNLPGWFGQLTATNYNGDSCDAHYNIFLDPLFEDPGSGTYNLTWDNWPVPDYTKSPCIDAGDPSNYDPDGTRPDMGAVFFTQFRPLILSSVSVLDFGMVDIGQTPDLDLILYNHGNDTLLLYNMINQHPVFTHNWNQADSIIYPGDSLTVDVTFAPVDTNQIIDTLLIENNDKSLQVQLTGEGRIVVGIDDPREIPGNYKLYAAYPNPFNSGTNIEFDLPCPCFVTLKIYNSMGEEVGTLISKALNPGKHKYLWNAHNLASGIYFYRLTAGKFNKVRKVILLQ